jgi:hypothetical protein
MLCDGEGREKRVQLVLNNFAGDSKEMKLMTLTFQNLFPMINVREVFAFVSVILRIRKSTVETARDVQVKLADCRRVVLVNYDRATERIEWRHYLVTVRPCGVSRGVRRLFRSQIPDLSRVEDIADYILGYESLIHTRTFTVSPLLCVVRAVSFQSRIVPLDCLFFVTLLRCCVCMCVYVCVSVSELLQDDGSVGE